MQKAMPATLGGHWHHVSSEPVKAFRGDWPPQSVGHKSWPSRRARQEQKLCQDKGPPAFPYYPSHRLDGHSKAARDAANREDTRYKTGTHGD